MGNGGISPYSGGSGGAGGPSGSGGRSPLEAMYTIIAVAIVLVFALIVELWKYPWQVWAFFAGIGILGYLCMRFWPHVMQSLRRIASWRHGPATACGGCLRSVEEGSPGPSMHCLLALI